MREMVTMFPLSPVRACAISLRSMLQDSKIWTLWDTDSRGMRAEEMAIISRVEPNAPPPPAGPLVYRASTSRGIQEAVGSESARPATRKRISYGVGAFRES